MRPALAAGPDADFARRAAATIRTKSPTSLKIALAQLRRGKSLDFEACLRTEFRIVSRVVTGHDFYEGIRAVIVDKDHSPALAAADARRRQRRRRGAAISRRSPPSSICHDRSDHHRSSGKTLDPVHAGEEEGRTDRWTPRLVLFLRVMAAIALMKGLYHWAIVCGFYSPSDAGFEDAATPVQAATVFFGVIDLVAAVGLWLAAPWGAVVWLTSVISMVAVEVLFPQIYGGRVWVVAIDMVLIFFYLWLALMSAREQPQ